MDPLTWLIVTVHEAIGKVNSAFRCGGNHEWEPEGPAWSSVLTWCRRCHLTISRGTGQKYFPK